MQNRNKMIRHTPVDPKLYKNPSELFKSCSQALFKSVQRLLEPIMMDDATKKWEGQKLHVCVTVEIDLRKPEIEGVELDSSNTVCHVPFHVENRPRIYTFCK